MIQARRLGFTQVGKKSFRAIENVETEPSLSGFFFLLAKAYPHTHCNGEADSRGDELQESALGIATASKSKSLDLLNTGWFGTRQGAPAAAGLKSLLHERIRDWAGVSFSLVCGVKEGLARDDRRRADMIHLVSPAAERGSDGRWFCSLSISVGPP